MDVQNQDFKNQFNIGQGELNRRRDRIADLQAELADAEDQQNIDN
jgi:hypothetical protein